MRSRRLPFRHGEQVFVHDSPYAQGPAVFVASLPGGDVLVESSACGRCGNRLHIVPRASLYPKGTPARDNENKRSE